MSILYEFFNSKITGFHDKILLFSSLVYSLIGMNVILISVTLRSIIIEWNLSPMLAGMMASAGFVGMFVGALSSGMICDFIGRKKTLVIKSLINYFCF